ncbi:hypothetical protein [Cupriavidus sp. TMH.W2]|uniref:hypothetical protein n=1 Tax=Cupriavidus sp. TMH.W2 TaxID=3434465 RepID=UPI003D7754CF
MDLAKLRGLAPRPRELAYLVGGIAMAGIVTVSAQQAASSGDAPPCPISDSIQQAINSKVQLVGVTGTDVSKYFAVGSAQSCIDSLLNTSFDLSKLIPDPIGWLSDAAQFAIKKATEAAVGKVCTAARNSMGDIIGKYNQATGLVQGWKSSIDTNIAGQSVASYGTTYSQSTSVRDVLADVPANTMTTGTTTTTKSNGTSGTTITTPSGTSGTTITSGVPAPMTNPTPFTATPAATPNAQSYQTSPQYQQSQPAQPVTPATVGTSVFGR